MKGISSKEQQEANYLLAMHTQDYSAFWGCLTVTYYIAFDPARIVIFNPFPTATSGIIFLKYFQVEIPIYP